MYVSKKIENDIKYQNMMTRDGVSDDDIYWSSGSSHLVANEVPAWGGWALFVLLD